MLSLITNQSSKLTDLIAVLPLDYCLALTATHFLMPTVFPPLSHPSTINNSGDWWVAQLGISSVV